jgi:hypothetical protein
MPNILDITNILTTINDNTLLYGGSPAATPEGYEDAIFSKANLLKEVAALIVANAANISTNADDITTLQSTLNVDANLNVSGFGNRTLPANGVIIELNITVVSGTNVEVLIGTTVGGDELADYSGTKALTTGGFKRKLITYRNTVTAGESSSKPIYFTVTGGSVHIHTYYRLLTTT